MEIATTVVGRVVEHLMVPVKEHLGYLISYKKYVRDMVTEKEKFDGIVSDVVEQIDHNKRNNFKVPSGVDGWLKRAGEIDDKVKIITHDDVGCFNLLARHRHGRKASKIVSDITLLTKDYSQINWTNIPIPLGKVDSLKAPTFTPSSLHNDFKSREYTFMEALKALVSKENFHKIALCGMGGVGKTTMMENLQKAVTERNMFNLIVKVVMGQKVDIISIQDAVAAYIGTSLSGTSIPARAVLLGQGFKSYLDAGKNILVILDDVWNEFNLKDIGLDPLTNQGIGLKFLITSREQDVCTQMGVAANSLFKLDKLATPESESFFDRFVKVPNDDPYLHKIRAEIIRKCCGLPIALKTLACSLIGKEKSAWEDALTRLENCDIKDFVNPIFEISYNNIKGEESKSFFLLCCLFPEDFDIPIEDLMRYGWGLQLFNKVKSISQARTRLNTCLERLIHANLLIQREDGCVKMHDLIRDFALEMCSKGENASIVDDVSKWSKEQRSVSWKRISSTLRGMCEFPEGFKYPDLSFLKLTHGDYSLKFPNEIYGNMENLEVIAYEMIRYPLLPRSPQCSTNLRTLCLHQCSLISDCSSIGNLSSLEVLSIADCHMRRLPSAIGKLKELKLLDFSGLGDLCVDDGVLKNLANLEELYLRVESKYGGRSDNAVQFNDANINELVECSKNLTALRLEFLDRNIVPQNMSYEKLERFKISLGCLLKAYKDERKHSFENTLMLVTHKYELFDSGMNVLLEKTKVLHLEVDGINDLAETIPEPLHHHTCPFYNLRVLDIHKCAKLKYLFTVHVANGLTMLEYLTISSCPVLHTLVYTENDIIQEIKLPALKFLSLSNLPELMGLCNADNVMELRRLEELTLDSLPKFTSIYSSKIPTPSASTDISTLQRLLNTEVVISKLQNLKVSQMEMLKEIWPSNSEGISCSILRMIEVEECNNLVNLFPGNPMPFLPHLEDVQVRNCDSIEVLFNIDLGCDGKMEEVKTCLKSIKVKGLDKLREVWRIKGAQKLGDVIRGFEVVEHLEILECKMFRNVFTPIATKFDMRALTKVVIDYGEAAENNELVSSNQEQEVDVISTREILEVDDTISNVAFSSYLIQAFHQVDYIHIENYSATGLLFEMKNPSCKELEVTEQPLLLPNPDDMKLNKVLFFHNLTTIRVHYCRNITYIFSAPMVKLLSNLKRMEIYGCDSIEEIVSDRNDEEMITSSHASFPHLERLELGYLPKLKCIGGGASESACGSHTASISTNITTNHDQDKLSQVDYISREIVIWNCDALSRVIPSSAFGQMQKLEDLGIGHCKSLEEVFETQGTEIDEGSDGFSTISLTIPTTPQLSSLTKLSILGCDLLQHVFTFSTLESLQQLKVLWIGSCKAMNVIVKEEIAEQAKVVEFPRLKFISLINLPNLNGFFLGRNKFRWPLLDDVVIKRCPQMEVFTTGHSMSPKLSCLKTDVGIFSLEHGLNFQTSSSNLEATRLKLSIPSNEWLQVQNLETIDLQNEYLGIKEFFVAYEGIGSGLSESPSVDKIPNLREIELFSQQSFKCILKDNPWIRLEFPNLTKVNIHDCESLQHVFTSSMVGSLSQLQELDISLCQCMEVIVKEDDVVHEKVNEIILPHLRSLKLYNLERLEGFCLGDEAFSMPSLDTLVIEECPAITVFTKGESVTPELRVIETSFEAFEGTKDLNSFIWKKQEEGFQFGRRT